MNFKIIYKTILMKISVISDTHLGFGYGTELFDDPFENLEEALEKSKHTDLILMPGDIFDTRTPGTETLVRTISMLQKLEIKGVKIIQGINKNIEDISHASIVAIHGTHERRIKGLLNPVEALEKLGFLIYLHCNGVVVEKDGEKVCIQGMSGVPEQFAEAVLKEWNPRPKEGCFNILMLHQSVSPFVYGENIGIDNIPKGFDLYVLGHMHEKRFMRRNDSLILIPGSLVTTQITKESVQPRGLWVFDTEKREAEFIELEKQRKIYYETLENPSSQDIENKIKSILSQNHKKKPLIRLKVTGGSKIDFKTIEDTFKTEAVLSFKREFEMEDQERKTLHEHVLSVQELGSKILRDNLKNNDLDPKVFEEVFELFLENKIDDVEELLRKNIK